MRILIATGGTGGHIFPAIETAKALRTRGHEVSFAGVLDRAKERIEALGFPVYSLSAHGLVDRSFLGWVDFSRVMSQAIWRSFGVIRKTSPDKIIGFGGYAAFPVAMAASLLHCPVLIHEQNVVPGKANALLAKMARKVAISFEGSRPYLNPSKVVWTGCPCNYGLIPSKIAGLKAFGLEENKKTIALIGGSQGSQRLNEVFFEMIKEMPAEQFQAIHMTGQNEFPKYQKLYQESGLSVKVYAFINQIHHAYAAADVVIARAGAATVNELGLVGIPAVLVPYPFAGNHQKFNAQVLSNTGAAILLQQKDLTKTSLKEAVTGLIVANMAKEDILQKTKGLFQKDAALQLALVTEGL